MNMPTSIDDLPVAARTGTTPFEPVVLTDEQKRKWENVLAYFGWTARGMEYIMYRLLDNDPHKSGYGAIFTKGCKTACTDAKNIIINPDWFFAMSVKECLFVLAHEVAHVMRNDVELTYDCAVAGKVPQNDGSTLPFDSDLTNRAQDFIINAMLVESGIGDMPKKGCLDMSKFKPDGSWLDAYGILYKARQKRPPPPQPPGGDQGDGDGDGDGGAGNDPSDGANDPMGNGQSPLDDILPPGKSIGCGPDDPQAKRDKGVWQVELQAAQAMERSQGKMAGGMTKMFKDILEPQVPWYDKLTTLASRHWGAGGHDWKRPDRRFITRDIYLPSRSSKTAGWLVIWNDTSGSMSDEELELCNAELTPIVEDCRPKRLTVIWCDAQIHRVDELSDAADLQAMRLKGAVGRGGTSIHPVMEWIRDTMETPDMFIAFTDGEFDFPRQPPFPVIWASVRNDPKLFPYGEMVFIDRKHIRRKP